MMKIRLLCIGQKMPHWVGEAYSDFAKRVNGDCKIELVELPMAKRSKNSSVAQMKEKEAQTIFAALKPSEHLVALDVLGKQVSTPDLAKQLEHWQMLGCDIALLIGGPDGLHGEVLAKSQEKISLSKLTLPHPMVRVLLAEQLYRAWSINKGHPYHK